jgi:hypothetical protein
MSFSLVAAVSLSLVATKVVSLFFGGGEGGFFFGGGCGSPRLSSP